MLVDAVKEKTVLRLTRVWLWATLAGLPLVFYDGYFDITEVKTAWFALCSAIYLAGRLACLFQYGGARPGRPSAAELCALVLCFFSLMASLGSGFFFESVIGPEGRWQGTGMLWCYAALWFALRALPAACCRRQPARRSLRSREPIIKSVS